MAERLLDISHTATDYELYGHRIANFSDVKRAIGARINPEFTDKAKIKVLGQSPARVAKIFTEIKGSFLDFEIAEGECVYAFPEPTTLTQMYAFSEQRWLESLENYQGDRAKKEVKHYAQFICGPKPIVFWHAAVTVGGKMEQYALNDSKNIYPVVAKSEIDNLPPYLLSKHALLVSGEAAAK